MKEVANLAERMFKLTGNFQQFGEWSIPDPGFIGWVVVGDDGYFEGYMMELYPSVDSLRFVAGVYLEKTNQLAYYKLIRSTNYAALLYCFKDVNNLGEWVSFQLNGRASRGGDAKISIEEIKIDPKRIEKIGHSKKAIVSMALAGILIWRAGPGNYSRFSISRRCTF